MTLLQSIQEKARQFQKKIVLPEGTEERTLKAADIVLAEGLARLVLIGSASEIRRLAEENGLQHISKAEVVDPSALQKEEQYIELMVRLEGA